MLNRSRPLWNENVNLQKIKYTRCWQISELLMLQRTDRDVVRVQFRHFSVRSTSPFLMRVKGTLRAMFCCVSRSHFCFAGYCKVFLLKQKLNQIKHISLPAATEANILPTYHIWSEFLELSCTSKWSGGQLTNICGGDFKWTETTLNKILCRTQKDFLRTPYSANNSYFILQKQLN